MAEEKITTIATTASSNIYYSQRCLLCENTKRLPEGMTFSHGSWICDECKEAFEFSKFLKSYNQELTKILMEETGRSYL